MTEEQFKVKQDVEDSQEQLEGPAATVEEVELVDAEVENEDQVGVEPEVQAALDQAAQVLAGVPNQDFFQLTKKNQQFMKTIDRHLAQDTHYEVRGNVYQEMVETLLDGQKRGQTAKQIYGTPTEVIQSISGKDLKVETDSKEQSDDKLLFLDGALLLGSVFTLLTGLSMMRPQQAPNAVHMGIITLILNYLVAGFAMMMTAKNLPNPDAPKGQKGYGRYFLISVSTMMLWFAAVSFSGALLPKVINPILPSTVYIVLGAVTLALRFYLKKKLNIKGTVF